MDEIIQVKKQLTKQQKEYIIFRYQDGISMNSIAKEIGVNHTTISRIIKKFLTTSSLERTPGSGRKRKTTEIEDNLIIEEAQKNINISSMNIKEIIPDLSISSRTIKRRIAQCNP